MTFYNRNGNPLCYCDDNEHIYTFNGEPIGYIYKNSLYNYVGNHIGWFENGWIIDPSGHYLFYCEDASGGPMKPMKKMKPMKSMKKMKPMKSMKEMKKMKPMKSTKWSNLDLNEFFKIQ